MIALFVALVAGHGVAGTTKLGTAEFACTISATRACLRTGSHGSFISERFQKACMFCIAATTPAASTLITSLSAPTPKTLLIELPKAGLGRKHGKTAASATPTQS